MDNLPILFMSKETEGREHIAEQTIRAIHRHLYCNKPITFFLCVAGSAEYYQRLKYIADDLINPSCEVDGVRFGPDVSAGEAWNDSIKLIFASSNMYLRMEDDFKLKAPLCIDPYIELLETNQTVGMVRLGLMPINLNLRSVGWYDSMNQGHIFFDCLPTSEYAYSGNPGLVHKRLHNAAGYFHTAHNPGDIEIDFDSKVRDKMREGGPMIWWPLDLGAFGTYGPFDHIGDVKSY